MTTLDIICRRLRDVGIFLLGLAAAGLVAQYIYVSNFTPEKKMERAIQAMFTAGFEKALAQQSKN